MFDAADAPDPDLVYANYLRTCAMLGIEPTPRERARKLLIIDEWGNGSSRTASTTALGELRISP